MLNQRYQIFVSSTYEDLRDERREILDTILQMGHFPTGMEHLPASGQMPWEIIKHMIDDCDYYVLVIAGRYGSMTEGDISYTEREYNYAMEIGKHILRFPHAAPEELPANRVEPQASMKRKLDAFRKEATSQGSFKTWKSATDLKLIVTQGLSYAFSHHAATGWVRADQADTTEYLKKLVSMQERIEELQTEKERLFKKVTEQDGKIAALDGKLLCLFAFGDDLAQIIVRDKKEERMIEISWNSVFIAVASSIIPQLKESSVHYQLTRKLGGALPNSEAKITESSVRMIRDQLLAHQLLEVFGVTTERSRYSKGRDNPFMKSHITETYWKLTQLGLTTYGQSVAIVRNTDAKEVASRNALVSEFVDFPETGE